MQTSSTSTAASRSAQIRERLDHPVIDADGHMFEYFPVFLEFMREIGGKRVVDKYLDTMPAGLIVLDGDAERMGGPKGWWGLSPLERREMRVTRPGFWGFPSNAFDRATVMLPKLMRSRLDEFGIDFSVVYPTIGLTLLRQPDEEIRRAGSRALNTMYAELFGPHSDRLTPAACIPLGTPQEAIEELEYAVKTLGLKAATMGTCVRRPIAEVARRAPELARFATWIDPIGFDSEYDYGPFWKKCVELGVPVTAHAVGNGWGARTTGNFIYNHLGHFAAAGEAFCKALVIGGVVTRFPTLRFAFLEGGVGWAANLYNDLVEHWETRNIGALRRNLDPKLLDRATVERLFTEYGGKRFEGRKLEPMPGLPEEDPAGLDEWQALGVKDPREFVAIFDRFYFGCEAEDRMTAVAFNTRLNHYGARLKAMFSSDVGHFDVLDMTKVLADAYELVEEGLMTGGDFRSFAFANAAELYTSMNPHFFDGTVVEEAVKGPS